MKIAPKEIKRLGSEGIEITWPDDTVHKISSLTLRQNCPSADAKAERSKEEPPNPLRVVKHDKSEQLRLEKIWQVGNYALGMEWGDGHNTGIYTYDFLYKLGCKESDNK